MITFQSYNHSGDLLELPVAIALPHITPVCVCVHAMTHHLAFDLQDVDTFLISLTTLDCDCRVSVAMR